jgi:YD repeat-containing protein
MRKHSIVSLLVVLSIASVYAQKAPNVALGFDADKAFQFGEIDSVNLFNGNVIVRLPIGPRYPVGGQVAYQFHLVHNSTVWDFQDNSSPACEGCKYAYPNQRSNAGTGWRLSLGRLISPADPGADFSSSDPQWVYESPAGDEHPLAIPYPGPVAVYQPYPDDVLTAADSSGLRMVRISATERIVEFPSGERHTFKPGVAVEEWRLAQIDDRFGNYVKVDYTDQSGRVIKWTVDDSTGRRHIVEFIHSDYLNNTDFEGQIVRSVQLGALTSEATPQPKAVYTFHYEDVLVAWPCSHKLATSHLPGQYPPATRTLLKRITLPAPDSSTFEFTHHTTANCYSAGAIATATLPTMGTYSYSYTSSSLPVAGLCGGSVTFPGTPVLQSKTVTTRDTSGTWSYVQTVGKTHTPTTDELESTCRKCEGVHECGPTRRLNFIWTPPSRWSRMTVFEPDAGAGRVRRDHYFSLWQGRMSTDAFPHELVLEDQAFGAHNLRYGLPITAAAPSHVLQCDQLAEECEDTEGSVGDGALLSTRMFRACPGSDPRTCAAADLLRSSYLRYRWYTFGYEIDRSRTVFNDDTGCSGAACWTEARNSLENGAGRFAETQTWSNFTAAAGSMTAKETTSYPVWSSVNDRLDRNRKWILDVFTEKTHTEDSVTAKSEYQFDDDGRLLGTRVRKNASARDPNDILTILGYDARRNVVQEKSYGGDLQALRTDNCCYAPNPDKPRYLVRNSYTHGVLSKSELIDRDSCTDISQQGCIAALVTADYDVDPRSGLITTSRDSAGVTTSYQYDAAFRLTDVIPTGSAASSYSYIPATSSANARVVETVKDGAIELMSSTYEFDGIGRVKRVSKSIPSDPESPVCGSSPACVAVTQTDFDPAGRKSRVSQPVEQTSHPTANVGTDWTATTHDALGRPVEITSPDGQVISFFYTGVRATTRTSPVATSPSGSTGSITTERYDAQGRLAQVEEYSGDTRASRTTGDKVTTDYGYDVGGRLATVNMKHTDDRAQARSFTYDPRGFLTAESHPESGTTTYGSYDARGHAGTKTEGGVLLHYEFDSAGRLTMVKSSTGRKLKEFKFATANDGSDLRAGKLYETFRDDERAFAGSFTVTESYEYRKTNGQMSKQKVTVARGGTIVQESETTLDYDALRLPATLSMPTCTANGCSAVNGIAAIPMTRTKGLLSSVGTFGTLSYHPSGMVWKVRHGSSPAATDTYETSDGIPRPSRINFAGGTSCAPIPAPAITAPDAVCGGATASASVTPVEGVTFNWAISGGTPASANGAGVSFTAGASGSVTLTATARSACGATASATKTVSITPPPAATLTTGPATILRGQAVPLSVTLTGPKPRQIVWSDGITESNIELDHWTRTVTPARTTSYSITSVTAGSCPGTFSGVTTVTVVPPPPAWVSAFTQQNRTIDVTWASVPDVDFYQVERRLQRDATGTIVTSIASTVFTDTVPESAQPVGYVYAVRAVAASTPSSYCPPDVAAGASVLYQQPQIAPRVTIVRAADLAELRGVVDALRHALHLTPGSYSPGAVIHASDFTAIIAALDAVRGALGLPPFAYVGVPPPAAGGLVRAAHVEQLREALR